MKIGILTSSFPTHPEDGFSTAGFFVRDFAITVASLGHDVTVITQSRGVERQVPDGIKVHWFPWWDGNQRLSLMSPYRPIDALRMATLFRSGFKCLKRLHAHEPWDHLLAMWAVPSGLLAYSMKQFSHVPFSTWCLGSDIWSYGRSRLFGSAVRTVLRASEHVFADSETLAAEAAQLAQRNCDVLLSSRTLIYPPPAPAGKRPSFLFVGRFEPVKGIDILLEAMAKFINTGGLATLRVFGGGPLSDYVGRRARQSDLSEMVHVGGFIGETQLTEEIRAADVVIIPSRQESLPLILSDSILGGRPVICSDVGDMGKLVRATRAGLVVPPMDADALCRAMQDFALRPRNFEEGIQKLANQFDLLKSANRWLSLIKPSSQKHAA